MGIDFVMILCFTALIVGYLFWLDLFLLGLYYFLMSISGVPKVYLVLFWLIWVFRACVIFIEDVRCAEGIPDNIG